MESIVTTKNCVNIWAVFIRVKFGHDLNVEAVQIRITHKERIRIINVSLPPEWKP